METEDDVLQQIKELKEKYNRMRKRGRRSIYGERMTTRAVALTDEQFEFFKAIGAGSMCSGIRRLADVAMSSEEILSHLRR